MIKEPYNFTENDLIKHSGLDKLSNNRQLGAPNNLDVDSKIKDYTYNLIGEGSYSSVWNV